MKITIGSKMGVPIQNGMIGLFFEDINYAADGGLYAEMIENRSFAFVEAEGQLSDYYTQYDGGYGWSAWPSETACRLRTVMGSPLSEENPHYMRVEAKTSECGLANQAYDGVFLKKGMEYRITFWARCVNFAGSFSVFTEKDGSRFAEGRIEAGLGTEETWNYFKKYELTVTAEENVDGGTFVLCLDAPGTVEFAFVSMFPGDAVAGIFRKDLFEKLQDLHPGFIRFPGGCIVEGNTLSNRYRYKDSLKPVWDRKNNWNRWAVHENCAENGYKSVYSHYNQTLGLGYYEYFLLCELIGAQPLPVLNVGFACQYQSTEILPMDDPAFQEYLQDAIDLIEFANGAPDTKWGSVRAAMGHEAPFGLTLVGVGNEQWQTEKADFFERYILFEQAIHNYDSSIKLIGSAGPDISTERYTNAWDFYHKNQDKENFVYAVDEHYYVKPEWLFEHNDFYDNYDRKIKVFSGEYAAHPFIGMNRPDANTLEGALAEAAFLTGVERNADVVVLASYAPLFARIGYTQWSPDMIWFDGSTSYGSPSYYVQKMYSDNMGTCTVATDGQEKETAKQGIYYNTSCMEETGELIIKIVNRNEQPVKAELELAPEWGERSAACIQVLSGTEKDAKNTITDPTRVAPVERNVSLSEGIELPALSFAVIRIKK